MKTSHCGGVLLLAVLCPGLAGAEPTASPNAAPASSAGAATRRDPDGVRGISPSREAVARGDRATVAHDLDAARREYQGAITFAPSDALGQLRTAELALIQGDLPLASEASAAALRYAFDDVQHARALYLDALVREAQGDLPRAAAAWLAYQKAGQTGSTPAATPGATSAATPAASGPTGSTGSTGEGPEITPHVVTAQARQKVAEDRQKAEADYAKVRERMQKELADADAARRASASK